LDLLGLLDAIQLALPREPPGQNGSLVSPEGVVT
jgi:hypothetical protein